MMEGRAATSAPGPQIPVAGGTTTAIMSSAPHTVSIDVDWQVDRGPEAVGEPQRLLLSALAQSHTASYLRLAAAEGVEVRGMSIRATAEVRTRDDIPDGLPDGISAAVLRPEVTLADESRRAEADALHTRAAGGAVSRSVTFPVTVEPRMPSPKEDEGRPPTEPPTFSRRLGAPIATLKPVGKPPAQVTGLPTTSSAASAPARSEAPGGEQQSFYDAVGGRRTFRTIVDTFYAQVAEDADFRAMYPEEDLEPAKERLLMFLEQYWGGPRTYQERRGHPRLRMRHMPFRVDAAARDTWLRYMRIAVDAADLSPLHDEILWDYLERAAHSMVNS